jgi:hypothetical protein
MKMKILLLSIAALFLASCNTIENESTSASMLQIASVTGNDLDGTPGSTTIFSDVLTNNSLINDNGVAEINALPIDPLIDSKSITPYMDVLVDQIDVAFKRTDGRNVEGVDVAYHFNQPMSMLVTINGSASIPFILIRHVAKQEPPLLALREWTSQGKILQLVATVTIHGKDLGGHRVAPVTSNVSVWCSNFADQTASSTSKTFPGQLR